MIFINTFALTEKTFIRTTVEPPLTATILQWPICFVPVDRPYINSLFESLYNGHLSTVATATKVCPPVNCQNNLSTTASYFSDWFQSQQWWHEIWFV